MKYNLYTVYDKKAQSYSAPMAASSNELAIRSFKAQVNDPNVSNMLYHAPNDFALYRSGCHDTETGEISETRFVTLVAEASELKETK